MGLPASGMDFLDIVPRCILGQLVRGTLQRLNTAKKRNGTYTMIDFRVDLFRGPAGRWAIKNQDLLCTASQDLHWLLPSKIANLLEGLGWTAESGNNMSITNEGQSAFYDIRGEFVILLRALRRQQEDLLRNLQFIAGGYYGT